MAAFLEFYSVFSYRRVFFAPFFFKEASLLFHFLSEEGSRSRTSDADLYELSDVVVALVDNHRLVLLGAAHHLLTAALAEVLNEDGEFLALVLLVLLGTHLGLQLDELVEAGYLGFLRNVVWQMLGCVGAWAL